MGYSLAALQLSALGDMRWGRADPSRLGILRSRGMQFVEWTLLKRGARISEKRLHSWPAKEPTVQKRG